MDGPEEKIRAVVAACADCDVCRHLMNADCLFFPELYRLFDKERETGEDITSQELRHLVDLCNFCALCPCPNIRADIIQAKTRFIDRDGLGFGVRTIEDVERIGKICGSFPQLTNFLLRNSLTQRTFKQTLDIHPQRRFPEIPRSVSSRNASRKDDPGRRQRWTRGASTTARGLEGEPS